jgi:hypothetical protein
MQQLLERVRLVQECLLLLRALLSSTPALGESLHVLSASCRWLAHPHPVLL